VAQIYETITTFLSAINTFNIFKIHAMISLIRQIAKHSNKYESRKYMYYHSISDLYVLPQFVLNLNNNIAFQC
jgi:hypothetical protein